MNEKSREELIKLAEALQTLEERQKYNKLKYVFPLTGPYSRDKYKPALTFMSKGKDHRFRVYMGGNRSGKSYTMGVEIAYHATGEYPDWWTGKVLNKPRTIWIIGESGKLWRDSLQKLLLGEPGEDVGTGLLPLAEKNNGVGIIQTSALEGTALAIGQIILRHKKGHTVQVVIKTNEMTREQFQAAKVDVAAFDEEPREDIYTECLMRLMGTGKEPGISMLAFTPMKGLSNVVLKFLPNGQVPDNGSSIENSDNYICRVEWTDVPHLSKEDKETLLKQIPAQEREARSRGIPALGSGKVYPIEEEFITCTSFEIPDYWPKVCGLDYGWTATAGVWVAEDPRTHIKYIYGEYKRGHVVDELHIEAIKAMGKGVPILDDPHCGIRDDGKTKRDFYRSKGLDINSGIAAPMSGIDIIRGMLETGRLKVMKHCLGWFREYRVYRFDSKDPNKIARNQEDHLLDATRYGLSRFDYFARPDESYLDQKNEVLTRFNNRDTMTGY